MNTAEVAKALQPFDPYTVIVVRFRTTGGGFFEMPIQRVEYMPSVGDADAYVALVPFQNLDEPNPPLAPNRGGGGE